MTHRSAPLTYSPAQASHVLAAARHIEQHGPAALRLAAGSLGALLRLLPPQHRRTTALAISEIALRDAQAPLTPANSSRRSTPA